MRKFKCLLFRLPLRFGLRCECPPCQIASDAGRAIRTTNPGKNYIRRPPPLPPLLVRKQFLGGGGGVYILKPPRQDPPSFIHPPPLEGSFQGQGVGVYKSGPVTKTLTEGGDYVKANVNPRFAAGLPFPVPQILHRGNPKYPTYWVSP